MTDPINSAAMAAAPFATDRGASFDARYSDGRTAASHRARVGFDGAALVILPGGEAPPVRWKLKDIEIADPVTRRTVDVLLHEPGRAGGTVFVADPAFIRELTRRAPRMTQWSRRWMGLRPFVWISALSAVLLGLAWATDFSPARGIASLLPKSSREMLGREVVRSMSGGRRTCTDTAGKAALETLAKRLSEATGGKASFNISVVDSEVMNAFAAPGEQIVVMRKLIDAAGSPDEVAGVIAHEMGHGIELHPEAGIVRAVGLAALTEFIFGGGGLTNIGLQLAQLGYTRQAERQADQHAIEILKRAGIGTQGMIDFFNRIERMQGGKGDVSANADSAIDLLRTHPRTAERIQLFKNQPAYPATPALSSADWAALRGICGEPAGPAPSGPPAGKKLEDRNRDI